MSQVMTDINHEVAQILVDSVTKIIGCLDDTNHQVVQLLLGSDNDIGGSLELLKLLRDYLSCTRNALGFLDDLHAWLQEGLIPRLSCLNAALNQLKSDESKMVYVQTAALSTALQDIHTACDTLPFEQLCAVLGDQRSLCERLYPTSIDRENIYVYRTVIMTAAALALIYMVVCAFVTAPAFVAVSLAALAAVATISPTECRSRWMSQVLGKYEDKGKMVRRLMESNTWMILVDLEGIQIMIQDLLSQTRRLDVNIAPVVNVRKDTLVHTMIKDLEKKIEEFAKAVRCLDSKRIKCYKDVTDAREKIVGTTFR